MVWDKLIGGEPIAPYHPSVLSRSCRQMDESGNHQDPQEGMGNVLEIVRPLKHGYILRQIILVDTPKGPEKITQTGPNPLHRVAMHFA